MAVLELRAERLVAGGDALARQESGRVVFVSGALPGETVLAEMVAEWRDYGRAVVKNVVDPSPDRTAPPCPFVAGGCGGCSWQHIDPDAQRELKRSIVVEALTRTARLDEGEVRLGPALDPWGFRTTLRMAVDGDRLGFHGAASRDVVAVDHCLVAHPLLADVVADLRAPGADEVTLRCGVASGERLARFQPHEVERAARVPKGVVTGPRAAVHEEIDGTALRISAGSFFQTRVDGAALLVDAVRDAVGPLNPSPTIVDAYAGVGLFAATIGRDAEVVCVEQSASACDDARYNLRGRAATIIRGSVERWRSGPADAVIADPSRRGLGRKAVDSLAASGASRFVLVSCDAVAFARDARLLTDAGYRLGSSTLVDLFPHTPHVEIVSAFDRV
jgi:23S rRNA (uracil1939-C5)-methyltransferase